MFSKSLKICFFNAENLFLLFKPISKSDKTIKEAVESLESEENWQNRSSDLFPNKSLKKCHQIKLFLEELDPDILVLCEVGGQDSLDHFNQYFLQSRYLTALTSGNSERGIDIGYMVKKNLGFYFDLISNKNRPINFLYHHEKANQTKTGKTNLQSHKFSRDLVELRLFTNNREQPFMILLATHLKSQLDPDKIDPSGFARRQAELNTLVEIYLELEKKFPQIPILVGGDFNGNASAMETDREFAALYTKTKLRDILDIAQIPVDQRFTYVQIRSGQAPEPRQIDYCFLSPLAQNKVKISSVRVYRYKDEFNSVLPCPSNLESKLALPSDHYPICFEIDI